MKKPTILLVEDESFVRELIVKGLAQEGYDVVATASAGEFQATFPTVTPSVILLDLTLPDGDGFSLMKEARKKTDVPVIIVSGRNELIDRVVGLELGADDYVGKPVQMKELTARVKAQLRRYSSMKKENEVKGARKLDAEKLTFSGWTLDRAQMQVFDKSGASANLSIKEFKLLEALVLSSNRVLSREQLLDMAREDDYEVTDRAIDVQILRIRRKLKDKAGASEIIRSIRGAGYMCMAETEIV